MAIYRNSIFKSSLIPGLLATTLIVPLGLAFAQSDVASGNNSDVFVGDDKSTYGPIKASDTLWKIANAYRPDDSVTNYQVMVALFNTNPNAFVNNDINALIQGQYLRIPSLEEINQVVPFHRQKNADASLSKINQAIVSKTKVTGSEEAISAPANNQAVIAKPSKQLKRSGAMITTDAQSDVEAASTQPLQAAQKTQVVQSPVVEKQPEMADSDSDLHASDTTESQMLAMSQAAEPSVSNREVEESLAAVGEKLDDLQYELERSKQTQAELDKKLEQQSTLLAQAKKREQRLLREQEAIKKQSQGMFNSPAAYWSVIALLFILVSVLTVLVYRRRRVEQELLALKPGLQSGEKAAQPVKTSNNQKVNKATTKTASSLKADTLSSKVDKTQQVLKPASVLFDAEQSKDLESKATTDTQSKAVDTTEQSKANDAIADAFAKADIKDTYFDSEAGREADRLTDLVKNQANDTLDNDLNMEHIIDDMVDEDSRVKPAKLHSDALHDVDEEITPQQLREIDDFDDVEFDKLLQEISSESEHVSYQPTKSVSTPLRQDNEPKAISTQTDDFVEIEEIIAENELADDDIEPYQEGKIDVGLDEFPEFTQNVNPVNVDDDKHGVNAKLDLAQVYIEIGDEDNAAVILKNVMKLGNSAQQQQAQQLLYSLKP
ncbi:FimV/HubP family polar landmark protein [Thalassotalea mangrovi]|uniref:LysM domain-containing protein n=1 Tax=Thalassotalea mangrovi TaxID=2572245 RepID=A0A4U1B486_9GAMM|nr:FimV/HubP family polar landmark protein [Thalassotalea mangrovi]TKB45090.1 hypothetical protein E8M12_09650 [Thalassotalea mangrovi]